MIRRMLLCTALLATTVATSACAAAPPRDPAGPPALRRVLDSREAPDLRAAFASRDGALLEAIDRSLAWFETPGAKAAYPHAAPAITLEHARLSVAAFRQALTESPDADAFAERVARDFDLWASVGEDGRGSVLFTGYYTPVFRASRTATGSFRYPLYRRPPDLRSADGPEGVACRDVGGRIEPYPTRRQIEQDPGALGLVGQELAWLESDLDRFLVHVQGGARLEPTDGGEPMDLAFAATNGRPYTSVGRLLVDDGKIPRDRLNLPALRAYFAEHPDELEGYLHQNERYVFFRPAQPGTWPTGSLGFPVTPLRSLATDKGLFPPGGIVIAATTLARPEGGDRPFTQFLLDQDAGGAIRTPGRADIYVGVGPEAGETAGRQAHRGRLWFVLLKPERVEVARGARQAADG